MAKIVTPRLPEATEEYSREQLSQLIQTLDQVIFILNNIYITSLVSTNVTVILQSLLVSSFATRIDFMMAVFAVGTV